MSSDKVDGAMGEYLTRDFVGRGKHSQKQVKFREKKNVPKPKHTPQKNDPRRLSGFGSSRLLHGMKSSKEKRRERARIEGGGLITWKIIPEEKEERISEGRSGLKRNRQVKEFKSEGLGKEL